MIEGDGVEAYLDTWSVSQRALELHHSARDLITNGCVASVMGSWRASGMSSAWGTTGASSPSTTSGCSVWSGGGGGLDSAGVCVATTETGHYEDVSLRSFIFIFFSSSKCLVK